MRYADRAQKRETTKRPLQAALTAERVVLGLHGKFLVSGEGYRGGFCEKLLDASPMSSGANARWLKDRPAAGQG